VPISWTETRSEFKSPLRVVARSLWLSREGKTLRCRQLKERLDEAEWAVAQRGAVIDRQRDDINALKEKVWRLECQRWRPPQSSCCLSDDPPLKGHKFGVRMIGLAENLARVGRQDRLAHFALLTSPTTIRAIRKSNFLSAPISKRVSARPRKASWAPLPLASAK
jgi:hypothetical protein